MSILWLLLEVSCILLVILWDVFIEVLPSRLLDCGGGGGKTVRATGGGPITPRERHLPDTAGLIHMNSQSVWRCVQDLNSFRHWEGDTKCCLYSRSCFQQISVWKWRIGILQWSVTGSINHTRADTMPGNTDHTPGFFRWAFNLFCLGSFCLLVFFCLF